MKNLLNDTKCNFKKRFKSSFLLQFTNKNFKNYKTLARLFKKRTQENIQVIILSVVKKKFRVFFLLLF